MKIPRPDDWKRKPQTPPQDYIAAEDADLLASQAVEHVDRAAGEDWYEEAGTDVDLAALTLCRLRRARAGVSGGPRHGDAAVRAALEQASPEAVIWIASRAISYLDETGFPDAVEPWFPNDVSPR
jgi:hypothetical protein